jgi:hypothetical protein
MKLAGEKISSLLFARRLFPAPPSDGNLKIPHHGAVFLNFIHHMAFDT